MITTRTNIITVGDTVTFQAALGPAECLPDGVVPAEWRWSSLDTLVATVDSLTGIARGVSLGGTSIRVVHARKPTVSSEAALQVFPGGPAPEVR